MVSCRGDCDALKHPFCEVLDAIFIRRWGALLFVVCALTVYSAYVPAARVPILTAAVIEKLAIVVLIFFGPRDERSR
jgi:hypothetical protein